MGGRGSSSGMSGGGHSQRDSPRLQLVRITDKIADLEVITETACTRLPR